MCTRTCLTEFPCDVTAWDTFASFAAYESGGFRLNSVHQLVSMASTRTGEDDELDECVVVSADTSARNHNSVGYCVKYNTTHT